jgi:hypothetical protein
MGASQEGARGGGRVVAASFAQSLLAHLRGTRVEVCRYHLLVCRYHLVEVCRYHLLLRSTPPRDIQRFQGQPSPRDGQPPRSTSSS